MGYEVIFSPGEPTEAAFYAGSNTGYHAFADWASGLDESAYPDLIHLAEEGWAAECLSVGDQIDTALDDDPPGDEAIVSTAEELARLCGGGDPGEAMLITDGAGTDGSAGGSADFGGQSRLSLRDRFVAFARKARLPRKAHAGLNSGCGTGAGGFKHGNTCGKRVGAHGTGRGGTQAQRKKLADKIRALRKQARTPEERKQLVAAIRQLKAHERGTGDAAQAAKVRRAIHAGKAPKVAAAPKQPTGRERIKAAVAAKRAERGLSDAARKNKAEGLRRERTRKAEVRAKAERARKIKAAVGKRRKERGLIPEQRAVLAREIRARRAAARTPQVDVTAAGKSAIRAAHAEQAKAAAKVKGDRAFEERRAVIPHLVAGKTIGERLANYKAGDAKVEHIQKVADHFDRQIQVIDAARRPAMIRLDELSRQHAGLVGPYMDSGKALPRSVQSQVDKIKGEFAKLDVETEKLAPQRAELVAKRAQAVREILKTDNPVRPAWASKSGLIDSSGHPLDPPDAAVKGKINEGLKFLRDVMHRGDSDQLGVHIGVARAGNPDRAHFSFHSGGKPYIRLAPDTDAATVVHEYGHAFEDTLKTGGWSALGPSLEFKDHRIGSEQPQQLNKLFPNSSYRDNERGAKDKFDAAFTKSEAYYIGKDYGRSASEIMSMGMEALYRDPVHFARKDPEYFKFVVGHLDGSLR